MIRKMYISGPMTGLEDWNYPAFHAMAAAAESAGWLPINPADNFGGKPDLPKHVYMLMDIQNLLHAQAILMLVGWEQSVGARLERKIAQALDLHVFYAADGIPYETEVE